MISGSSPASFSIKPGGSCPRFPGRRTLGYLLTFSGTFVAETRPTPLQPGPAFFCLAPFFSDPGFSWLLRFSFDPENCVGSRRLPHSRSSPFFWPPGFAWPLGFACGLYTSSRWFAQLNSRLLLIGAAADLVPTALADHLQLFSLPAAAASESHLLAAAAFGSTPN